MADNQKEAHSQFEDIHVQVEEESEVAEPHSQVDNFHVKVEEKIKVEAPWTSSQSAQSQELCYVDNGDTGFEVNSGDSIPSDRTGSQFNTAVVDSNRVIKENKDAGHSETSLEEGSHGDICVKTDVKEPAQRSIKRLCQQSRACRKKTPVFDFESHRADTAPVAPSSFITDLNQKNTGSHDWLDTKPSTSHNTFHTSSPAVFPTRRNEMRFEDHPPSSPPLPPPPPTDEEFFDDSSNFSFPPPPSPLQLDSHSDEVPPQPQIEPSQIEPTSSKPLSPPPSQAQDTSSSSSSSVPGKLFTCPKTCVRKCGDHFTDKDREAIKTAFLALNRKQKRLFISNHAVKTDLESGKKKSCTIRYHLKTIEGKYVRVCLRFFLTTLGFHPKNDVVVRSAVNSYQGIPKDLGRKRMIKCRDIIDREKITTFIQEYDTKQLDFESQHATKKRPSELTIKSMYKDYLSKHCDRNLSYSSFYRVFRRLYKNNSMARDEHFADFSAFEEIL